MRLECPEQAEVRVIWAKRGIGLRVRCLSWQATLSLAQQVFIVLW